MEQPLTMIRNQSSILKLAPLLRSKLVFTEIMSYAFTYEEALQVIQCLCKAGTEFIDKNPEQLRYFCLSQEIETCALTFGKRIF